MKTIHPLLGLLAVVAILLSPLIFHDSIATRNTVYSSSFAEAAFMRIQLGDSQDAVVAALGAPLSRHYILRYPGDSYNSYPAVPPEQLPERASIHWEILEYSRSKNPPSDFRLLEVALDAKGVVAFTRNYVTD
jgi:hypothetical protein